MSSTKTSMLSSTHAIFRGLQEDICKSLVELPDSAPAKLKTSLMKAHRKPSDYYSKLDKSPYYIWASCEWFVIACCYHIVTLTWNSIRSSHFVPRPSCRLWWWHITKESSRALKRLPESSLPWGIHAQSTDYGSTTFSTTATIRFPPEGQFYCTIQAMVSHQHWWIGGVPEVTTGRLWELWSRSVVGQPAGTIWQSVTICLWYLYYTWWASHCSLK